MNLRNSYRVIYENIASGNRTFYATKNAICDPTVDDKIVEAAIGQYKLIYEKDGKIYGSTIGIPAEGDHCFTEFDKVFKETVSEPATVSIDEPVATASEEHVTQTNTRRTRKTTAVEEPAEIEAQ